MIKELFFGITVLMSGAVIAQTPSTKSSSRPQMKYLGTFDAGQPDVGIYKMYDPTDDVLCYIMMPDIASRKQAGNKFIYEANSIGSISCLKPKLVVQTIPAAGNTK